jgi:hypothetical protein
MPTVINHPYTRSSDSGFGGVLISAVVLVILALLFFMFIMPSIRANNAGTQDRNVDVNVKLPTDFNNAPAPAPSTNEPAPTPSQPAN